MAPNTPSHSHQRVFAHEDFLLKKNKQQSTFSISAHEDRLIQNTEADTEISSGLVKLVTSCANCFINMLKPNIYLDKQEQDIVCHKQ